MKPYLRPILGFTLIELLVVVAIIAILSSVAVPSYMQYTARANRADAKNILLSNAQFMERVFTECGVYNAQDKNGDGDCADAGDTLTLPLAKSPMDGTAKYTIAVAATATTFTLTATRAGSMASDACGNLTLTNLGVKSNASGSLTAAECWNN